MAITTMTLLATSVALAAASAGVSAYSAVSSAAAQKSSAKYNAAVERNNAMAASQQAELEVSRIRDRNRRMLAKQQNAIAGSGMDLSSSTAFDLYSDSAAQGELDAAIALYTGQLSSTRAGASAKLYNLEAKNASTAGSLGLASSILGGASNVTAAYTNPALNPKFR